MTITPDRARRLAIESRRDELLTVQEYALLLRQHEKTIRRRIRAGTERGAVKIGGAWRIDLSVAVARRP